MTSPIWLQYTTPELNLKKHIPYSFTFLVTASTFSTSDLLFLQIAGYGFSVLKENEYTEEFFLKFECPQLTGAD